MNKRLKGFIVQLGFLTRIPVHGIVGYNSDLLGKGILFAPVTGLIIATIVYWGYRLSGFGSINLISIVIALFIDLVITGGLHYDGMADTCDGLFSYRDRDGILEIMKDPRSGTNGVLGLIFAVIFKFVLLYSLKSELIFGAIVGVYVISRCSIVCLCAFNKYARAGSGFGKSVVEENGLIEAVISLVLSVVLIIAVSGIKYLYPIPVMLIVVIVISLYMKIKLGGVTGDIIGFTVIIIEVVCLFVYVLYGSLLKFLPGLV